MSTILAENGSAIMAKGAAAWARVQRLPGFRRRRVRVWALVVGLITVALGIQAFLPGWHLLPQFAGREVTTTTLIIFLAAIVCEYMDSSLGMGYGTTLTPILLLAGFEPLQVVPAILFSECLTGICACLLHHRDGNVNFLRDRRAIGTAVLLLVLTVIGVLAAVSLTNRISNFGLTAAITGIIIGVGVLILVTARRQLRFRPVHLVALGALAAFNKGLSGGGYGPLVTGGQVVSGMSPKNAVAVTSLAEGLTCLVGVVSYFYAGKHIDWSLAIPLTTGALLSVPMATLTLRKLPEAAVRRGVGVMTCLLGAVALAKLVW